ncbi:MAG: hypothetical protein U0W40_01630 [Acidimicrobiia bacterium]
MPTADRACFGVDLGGTNTRVALVDPDGTVVEQRIGPTAPTLDGIVEFIADTARRCSTTVPTQLRSVWRGRHGRP